MTTREDGTVSVSVRSRGEVDPPAGSQLRWSPSLTVSADAPNGPAALAWRLSGTIDGRSVTAGG